MAKTRWLEPAQEQAWRRYRRMRTLLDLQIARDLKKDSGLSEPDYDVLSSPPALTPATSCTSPGSSP